MVESNIPSASIKMVFVVHFILTAWGAGHWCPLSYLFYNLIFFLILLWAVHHREGDEPVQMAVAVGAVSIVLDVMVLSLYFPSSYQGSERFSAGMAILNLIIRPFTTLILYRVYVERASAVGAPVPSIFGASVAQRSPYEDIDSTIHQSVPHTDIPIPSQDPFSSKMPPPYHT